MNRKLLAWLEVLGGPALALIVFFVGYNTDPFNVASDQTKAVAAIPAFFLSVVVLLIGQAFVQQIQLRRAETSSDRVYDAVRNYLHIIRLGTPSAAFEYVLDRLPSIQEVRNTSFNLPRESGRVAEVLYDTKPYQEAPARIGERIAQGLLWKDVGDEGSAARFRKTEARARIGGRIANRAGVRGGHGYEYRLLSKETFQINFIILTFRDGGKEVLFNWDYRAPGADPVVLLSRDSEVTHMFTVHFDLLWDLASPDHDNSAQRSTS